MITLDGEDTEPVVGTTLVASPTRVRVWWVPVWVPIALGVFWGAWTKWGFWWGVWIALGWPMWFAYRFTLWASQ